MMLQDDIHRAALWKGIQTWSLAWITLILAVSFTLLAIVGLLELGSVRAILSPAPDAARSPFIRAPHVPSRTGWDRRRRLQRR